MKKKERGQVLILVLILLALGALLLTPTLSLNNTALKSKRIQTQSLKEFYAMSGGMEYGIWQLLHGDAASQLSGPGDEQPYTVTINGVTTTVVIRMQVALGDMEITGAEGNRIRPSKNVECDVDGDGVFNEAFEDCAALPAQSGMRARYTVLLDQVSPDTSAGLVAVYDELPPGFTFIPGSVTSPDGSFPEITTVTPTDIQPGGNEIWKWQFTPRVYFQQGEVKQFTFLANIRSSRDRYCNGVFLKLEALPNEKSDKRFAQILVGSNPPQGCQGGATMVRKYVDRLLALPNQTNIFTYMVNIENADQNTLHVDRIKDVLAQGGFTFCSSASPPPTGTCDPPMYKTANDPFDPQTGSFTDTTGFTNLPDPQQTLIPPNNRWQLLWDGPGGAGWDTAAAGQAGDVLILRFQAYIVPTESGSFYNEIFADVNCSFPIRLGPAYENVTTAQDYCASYSWPSGGVAVPTYDVRSDALRFSGQGNVTVDWNIDSAQLNSWHVN